MTEKGEVCLFACFVFVFVLFFKLIWHLYTTILRRRDWNSDPDSPIRVVPRLENTMLLVFGRQIKGEGVMKALNYHDPGIADLHPSPSLQTGI